MTSGETKIKQFDRIYKEHIKTGAWISKDDMAEKGFFPKSKTNGRDIRFIKKKYELKIEKKGNKEIRFRITGTEPSFSNRPIRKEIIDKLRKKECPVTGTNTDIEIDHKNGRYNDPRVLSTKTQTIDDFQPLHKIVNNIKREHCKKCAESNLRFDAKKRGFLVSTLDGKLEHNNRSNGCEGCYWNDISYFTKKHNEIIGKNYGKEEFDEKEFHNYYINYEKGNNNTEQ